MFEDNPLQINKKKSSASSSHKTFKTYCINFKIYCHQLKNKAVFLTDRLWCLELLFFHPPGAVFDVAIPTVVMYFLLFTARVITLQKHLTYQRMDAPVCVCVYLHVYIRVYVYRFINACRCNSVS